MFFYIIPQKIICDNLIVNLKEKLKLRLVSFFYLSLIY